MADDVALCANCDNKAHFGPLCQVCEQKWLKERVGVVEAAEHLTDLAAQFRAWCADHGHPDPFKD